MLPLTVQFLVALVVSAFNERMARRFQYLHEENRVLREIFTEVTGRKRIPSKGFETRPGSSSSKATGIPSTRVTYFTVETLGAFGAVRQLVFFVMELKTRRVHIAGVRIAPNDAWMKQIARNLLDCCDGFLRHATHLIHDRDLLFSKAWRTMLGDDGTKCVRIPRRSPNCNPFAERFVRSIRNECLNHFVILGEHHLRHLLREYVVHYNAERFHQGLGGRLVTENSEPSNDNGISDAIQRRKRLGGILNFYHRKAA